MPIAATWMELESLILSEVKSKRERQVPYDITYIWNLIYSTNKLSIENKIVDLGNRLMVAKGEGEGLGAWGK